MIKTYYAIKIDKFLHDSNEKFTFRLQNGKIHCDDGPAVVRSDGSYAWYKNGLMHREGGPAFKNPEGYEIWYLNGERHRLDGPAFVVPNPNGFLSWYKNGVFIKTENLKADD